MTRYLGLAGRVTGHLRVTCHTRLCFFFKKIKKLKNIIIFINLLLLAEQ